MANILKIKNEQGEWIAVPAIKGDPGEVRPLYSHTIYFGRDATRAEVTITIINDVSKAYTSLKQVAAYLYAKGYTDITKTFPATGTQMFESESGKFYLDIASYVYAPSSTRIKIRFRHLLEQGVMADDEADWYKFGGDDVLML